MLHWVRKIHFTMFLPFQRKCYILCYNGTKGLEKLREIQYGKIIKYAVHGSAAPVETCKFCFLLLFSGREKKVPHTNVAG